MCISSYNTDFCRLLLPWDDIWYLHECIRLPFHLDINGSKVQEGNTSNMLFSVDKIIAYVSRFFTLKIGDLIYTGTPAGVGPVKIDDHLEGYLGERKLLDFYVR